GVPLVTVDVSVRGVPHTVIDDVTGGRLATEHLLALGHTRIGFIGDLVHRNTSKSLGFLASERRLDGYRRALDAAGLPAGAGQEQELIKVGPHGPAHAEAFTAELLSRPDPPTAIFAASDTQAMGVLAAADRLDIGVPGQLSVIGFDDIQLAALIGLSTVRQPLEESGAEGARRLCALLRGEQVKPLRQLLALTVVQRGSTTGPGRAAARPPVPAGRQELPQPLGQVSERAGDRS
ncbi:MAG TPA: substrate-binding domain-containing protein, partial [Streptosporangiaceae bacterium]|nr:substrate-binding domain-containing protein [Streptosporangiaceae bacterium]